MIGLRVFFLPPITDGGQSVKQRRKTRLNDRRLPIHCMGKRRTTVVYPYNVWTNDGRLVNIVWVNDGRLVNNVGANDRRLPIQC